MTPVEPLDVAVRAWALPDGWEAEDRPGHRHKPRAMVVLDCETELAGPQRLLVGCYRYVRVSWKGAVPSFSTAEEGLVVPDDAEDDVLGAVRWYAATHEPEVDPSARDACRDLLVLSRHDFCERMLWEACWRNRATLVGFNLAFDLSRLALSAHAGRGRHAGGFVLRLWEHEGGDNRFRPNVVARRVDNKRTLFSWTGVKSPPDDGARHTSADDHFLDLRALVFALRNDGHSLESAGAAFATPYEKRPVELGRIGDDLMDYVRDDVAATTRLARAALSELHRHPVPLSADRALSPAAIGRAYLRQMGVTPPLSRSSLSHGEHGQAMEAFYGPRVEVRIRHVPVPVTLVDFSSQYANVARLLRVFDLLSSERLSAVEATDEVRALLEEADVDEALSPSTWPKLVGFGLVSPEGDWLPSRAWFSGKGDVPRVGIGPLTSSRPMWFSLPDLVAEKVLTGRVPKLLRAWRLEGEGRLPLRSVLVSGRVPFDPGSADWWEALVEARSVLGGGIGADTLKAIASTTAYGDFVRMDQQAKEAAVTVHRSEGAPWRRRAARPESPHPFSFPPFAAAVTGGGRLLVATLERLVSDVSGCWASANTDSAAVVSSEVGGLVACPGGPARLPDGSEAVRALSWRELDTVRERFFSLGVALNVTPENFDPRGDRRQLHAVGVAGSRVIFFADGSGGREVVKRSEVALGDLRSPLGPGTSRRFVDEAAAWMLERVIDGPGRVPAWFDEAAMADLSMGTPGRVASLGGHGSPFGFAMGARRARRVETVVSGERVRLVAPAGDDPETARWVEVPSGNRPRVVVGQGRGRPGDVRVATYGEEVVSLLFHPESKMLGPNGEVCKATTKGLLTPRPVEVGVVHLVGKEGNRVDEVAIGEVLTPEEVLTNYGDDEWERLIMPAARAYGIRRLARETGLARSKLTGLLAGRSSPRLLTREAVRRALALVRAEQEAPVTTSARWVG